MDLLAKLEQALEGVFEGMFTRAFKAPLQPIEVAKRLTREMENHRTVSVSATYVPNLYTVHLAPETLEEFTSISKPLLGELEQYLRDFVMDRQYQTVGPIAIRLAEGEQLKPGELSLTAVNDASAVPSAPPPAPPLRSSAPPDPAATTRPSYQAPANTYAPFASLPATSLQVTGGEIAGRTLQITDGITIGRGSTNTLALSEPGVSRQHAEIIHFENNWVLRDLGSTNGTFVNERRIKSYTLHPGDVIKIGQTVILVR